MMKYRDTTTTLLLAIFVPFYVLYWLHDTAQRLRSRQVPDVPNFILVLMPMILLIGGIALFIPIAAFSTAAGSNGENIAVIFNLVFYFVLYPISIVCSCIYFLRFSKAAALLVGSDMSPGVQTLLYILLPFLPVYFIQDKINKWVQNAAYPQPAQPAHAPQQPHHTTHHHSN